MSNKNIAISLFLLLVFPSVFQAQKIEAQTTQQSKSIERRISAFSLVCAAYRGRFKDLGVPGYAKLDQAYRGRQLSALDLVEAAVEANELPSTTLQDKSYIHAVDKNLYGLVTR